MKTLNNQFGTVLKHRHKEKGDMHILIQLLSEDDEVWFNVGNAFSSYWIDDLIEVLQSTKKILDSKFQKDMWGYEDKDSEIGHENDGGQKRVDGKWIDASDKSRESEDVKRLERILVHTLHGNVGQQDIRWLVERARKAERFEAIVDDTTGVAGYHMNGDIADWDEFDL